MKTGILVVIGENNVQFSIFNVAIIFFNFAFYKTWIQLENFGEMRWRAAAQTTKFYKFHMNQGLMLAAGENFTNS